MALPHQQITSTEAEIVQQPEVWRKVFELVRGQRESLSKFLSPMLAAKDTSIILTGAGSSAFIGQTLELLISRSTGLFVRAIATTDLVTHPEIVHQRPNSDSLIVSFARSGNSPESEEALRLLNERHKGLRHLFITCNPNGRLAGMVKENTADQYCLLLPEETNDKSLAMTSSFTGMLLAALLAFNLDNLDGNAVDCFNSVCNTAASILGNRSLLEHIGGMAFSRAVFLGSGPMLGIANECHLKLQELSDGNVVCKYDSFLGFRHGPRAVVDRDTLMVYFLSQDTTIAKYEQDLVNTINKDRGYLAALHVGNVQLKNERDFAVPFERLPHDKVGLSVLPYVLIGQLIGFYRSLHLGLDPDNPSASGAISRVVQGVKIYK